jgi:hypothetical protein
MFRDSLRVVEVEYGQSEHVTDDYVGVTQMLQILVLVEWCLGVVFAIALVLLVVVL